MELNFGDIDWLALLACVVAGQITLTVWFVVLFGEPWAKAYGGEAMTKEQHTKEVPMYTYGIGAACVFLLSLTISLLHGALGVASVGAALQLACLLAVGVFVAMAMPGYAFLRKWSAWSIAAGSQVVLICVVSLILVLWP